MKRPEFDAFREIFLNCLSRYSGEDCALLEETKWAEMGDLEARREILAAVVDELRSGYGVEFEINNRLLTVDGPVETAIIQTFHELNTIFLMEKINLKIKSRLN